MLLLDVSQLVSRYRKSIKGFNENTSKSGYILNKIIDGVQAFGLAVRGHNITESSENPGIFRGLINFVCEFDSRFQEYIGRNSVLRAFLKQTKTS